MPKLKCTGVFGADKNHKHFRYKPTFDKFRFNVAMLELSVRYLVKIFEKFVFLTTRWTGHG